MNVRKHAAKIRVLVLGWYLEISSDLGVYSHRPNYLQSAGIGYGWRDRLKFANWAYRREKESRRFAIYCDSLTYRKRKFENWLENQKRFRCRKRKRAKEQ